MFDGITHLFRKKNKEAVPETEGELTLETETVEDVTGYLSDDREQAADTPYDEVARLCEQFIAATGEIEDHRVEYEAVTSYFDDISRIEQMPEDMRRELNDIAEKIEFLEKNQKELKKLRVKLSDDKYRMMSRYESEIPDIMRELSDMETRDHAIRRDMQHLENEKAAQDFYVQEAEEKQKYLRSIAISVTIMGLIVFAMIFWVYKFYRFSIELATMVTLFVITVVFVLLYLEYRNESYDIKLAQARKKRAVSLLNKVKIKCVNSTSTLDYMYEKYGIKNLRELEYLWEQYNMLVQETKRFQHSLGDMRVYFDEMERVLRAVHVKDPYIWTQQTRALLDEREMVEVKHELNTRRQTLRSQMEAKEQIKKQCLAKMKQMVAKEPALMETVRDILAAYHIDI